LKHRLPLYAARQGDQVENRAQLCGAARADAEVIRLGLQDSPVLRADPRLATPRNTAAQRLLEVALLAAGGARPVG